MEIKPISEKLNYIAFLRGINVGGYHKVPMSELQTSFESMGFTGVKTLLNSGNVFFQGEYSEEEALEEKIADQLAKTFGFPIPVLIRKGEDIQNIIKKDPFKRVQAHKDIRLYITLLKKLPKESLDLPWVSDDGSFQILEIKDRLICSVLDVSKSKTTDAMNVLEKKFSKDITTRNWNTLLKIGDL